MGFLKELNGEPKLNYWKVNPTGEDDEYCNMLNGTDGAIYPPGVKLDEPVYIFNTDLCRFVPMIWLKWSYKL